MNYLCIQQLLGIQVDLKWLHPVPCIELPEFRHFHAWLVAPLGLGQVCKILSLNHSFFHMKSSNGRLHNRKEWPL